MQQFLTPDRMHLQSSGLKIFAFFIHQPLNCPLLHFPVVVFNWKAIQALCKFLRDLTAQPTFIQQRCFSNIALWQLLLSQMFFINHFSVFTGMQQPSTLNSSSPTVLDCSWGYLKTRFLPETYLLLDFGSFEIYLSIPHFHHSFLAS